MVAEADAVVVGRYLPGARFVESGTDRDGYYAPPSTLHPFEVMTVVRAALGLPTPGETIAIELLGGLREHPTHFERISVRPGLRRLGVGRLYAIFLKWNSRRARFEGAWFDAIFDITSDRVWSLYEPDQRYTGRATDGFLSDLGLWGWERPGPVRVHAPPGFEHVPAPPVPAAPPPDHLREQAEQMMDVMRGRRGGGREEADRLTELLRSGRSLNPPP